jgi:hypothetical protein
VRELTIVVAALLSLGIGSTFTSERRTKWHTAGLAGTAFGLFLAILTAGLRSSWPTGWQVGQWTPEVAGWLIWSFVGLAGAAAALFSENIRLGLQGSGITAIATALLLMWADSPAAAMAILAAGAAITILVRSTPRRPADSPRECRHAWLVAVGAGILALVMLTAIESTETSPKPSGTKRAGKSAAESVTATTVADCLLPAIVVVAWIVLHRPTRRPDVAGNVVHERPGTTPTRPQGSSHQSANID